MTLRSRRVEIVGTGISLTDYETVMAAIRDRPTDRAFTVAVCNVHSVMSARRDPELAKAIEGADLATPDGMPLVWALRAMGWRNQQRVYGPSLMERCLTDPSNRHLSHYLYGSTPETLSKLESALRSLAPDVRLAGSFAPAFRPFSQSEVASHAEGIRASGADVVWVGLGMPKQEKWMARVAPLLPGVALVGVGAAFDILSGNVRQAPELVQKAGLEWAFRLAQEPRRLWRRYLFNNPAYLFLIARQLTRRRPERWQSAA